MRDATPEESQELKDRYPQLLSNSAPDGRPYFPVTIDLNHPEFPPHLFRQVTHAIRMRYRCYWGDEKYFYLVTRYVGYQTESDNGYTIHMIDRRTCSLADATQICRSLADKGATGPAYIDRIEPIKLTES